MYQQYGAAPVYQNNDESAFYYLSQKFAGRGLSGVMAPQNAIYGNRSGVSARRSNESVPMPRGEAVHNRAPVANVNRGAQNRAPIANGNRTAQSRTSAANINRGTQSRAPIASENRTVQGGASTAKVNRPTHARVQKNKDAVTFINSRNMGANALPDTKRKAKAPETPRRRAAMPHKSEKISSAVNSFALVVKSLPVGYLLAIIISAATLMITIGLSVGNVNSENVISDLQGDMAMLSAKESRLVVALEEKNDLRNIERIAVSELGMVKKDLVTRQYIKLSDEDIIENYEEEIPGTGLSTLLTAIMGGR